MAKKQSNAKESLKEFLAGGCSGVAQILVGHPFDTIKVRLQTDKSGTTALQMVQNTVKNEGFLAVYKGMLTPLVGIAFVNSVLFAAYGNTMRLVKSDPNAKPTLVQLYFVGGVAGVANAFVLSPIELVKTRLQVQRNAGSAGAYKGAFDCAKQILLKEGLFRGIFSGLSPTIVREGIGNAGFFGSYEVAKRVAASKLTKSGRVEDVPALYLPACGACGGLSFWLSSFPVDVVKSRIQANPGLYSGMIQCSAKMLKEEGFLSFYRGLGTALIRAVPVAAAIFTTYETAKKSMVNW